VVATMVAREIEHAHETGEMSKESLAAFDYTCRYYLNLSGAEFLARYDRGEFSRTDSSIALSRVFAMLPFVR